MAAPTPNGYDNAWITAINGVMEDREASVRIVDLDDHLWESFIGPLCDAIEDTHGEPCAPFAHLTTEYKPERYVVVPFSANEDSGPWWDILDTQEDDYVTNGFSTCEEAVAIAVKMNEALMDPL